MTTTRAVVLHTFFTDETLARSVAAVRRGAEAVDRDPASVRVWSVLATVGDHIDEELRLKKLVGRLGTYLQGYGDLLVRVNGWDPAVLDAFRIRDALIARQVRWTQGAGSVQEQREGRGSGIDADGRLLVDTGAGDTVALDSGEVHLIA